MADPLKVLVADKLAATGLEYLRSIDNVEVDQKVGLSEDELTAIVGEYDGMLVRSGVQVTDKVLANPGRLRAIVRAGVGVDNIDLDAATAKGVLVMNSAEASTITTAEHAFTLLMALTRNIGPAYRTMAEGGWDRSKFVGHQLHGKTLGVVGFGRIGRTIAERALAFGMNVLAFDPVYNADTALDGKVKLFKNFDDMIGDCDYLSFHVPLNENTRGMLNAERFAKCKDGVMVVNAARGGVVDIPALIEALDSGTCGGAAIDVYEQEPPADDDPIRSHPKILCTPHLGASTEEAQEAVSMSACEQLIEYLQGEGVRGAVNAAGLRLDLDPAQMRFVDLARRMAQLVGPMCDEGVSEVTINLLGPQLAGAGSTIERIAVAELLSHHLDLSVNMVNVLLLAEQRGIRVRTVTEDEPRAIPRMSLEVRSGAETRQILGSVYEDALPRVLRIGRYHMDMIPAGPMMLLMNRDQPGMVGLVGKEMGAAGVNIADMAISRYDDTALMVLKLDEMPDESLLNRLRHRPGILKVATVRLPPLKTD